MKSQLALLKSKTSYIQRSKKDETEGTSSVQRSKDEENDFVHNLSTMLSALPLEQALPCQTVASSRLGSTGNLNLIIWSCKKCNVECLPVTRESRCLCGHRLKEHDSSDNHKCASAKCKCRKFFYIVAEGSWMLRCRCKHKAIEHDCSSPGYKCSKCPTCAKFDSPWVCNCGCLWSSHSSLSIDPSVAQRKIGSNIVRKDGL